MTDNTIEFGQPGNNGRIEPVGLEVEVQRSFLDYAMSVIVSRALPDVRDGLKPVHRKILYAMYDSGFRPDRGYVKCARVVGEVMGKLHPHGDASIYDALVRLAQPFSMSGFMNLNSSVSSRVLMWWPSTSASAINTILW